MNDNEEKKEQVFYARRPLPPYIWFGVAFLVLLFIVSFGVAYYNLSTRITTSASKSFGDLAGGIDDLKQLKASSAEQKFKSAGEDFDPSVSGLLSKLKIFFGAANNTLSDFKNVSTQGVVIAQEVGFLQNNIFDLLLDKGGDKIISGLAKVEQALGKIDSAGSSISSNIGKLNSLSGEFVNLYLPLRVSLGSVDKFLGYFITWLEADSTHHILILLQNPSEIRPAGGFLGSYADVSINKGNVENVEVHDINDADRLLETRTVPPKPLQALVTNWRAADSNWFFDFPASAERVIKSIESSKLYSDRSLTFDGAIAITPRIMENFLSIAGKIDLPESGISLNKDNFVTEIQQEVQVGQSKKVTYPKKVIEEFSKALFARLKSLGSDKKVKFLKVLQDRSQSKDIEVYFKDKNFEDFLSAYGLSGGVSDLPADSAASYLAVVDSNIGGGKSDLYIKQNLTLQSQINADGTVGNHLSIDRVHEGNKARYWWYKVPNVDYLQIFVPPDSRLINFQGGVEKKIVAPTSYSKNGYVADELVQKIESSEEKVFNYPLVSSHVESGKKVFSVWARTKAGESSKTSFDYTHRLFLLPANGMKYEFIFEKQAGTTRHYKFEIAAPVGFKFAESNSPAYDYESDDPPGRLIVVLTLVKI